MNHTEQLTTELFNLRNKILLTIKEQVKILPTDKMVTGFHIFKNDISTSWDEDDDIMTDVITGINPDLICLNGDGDEMDWIYGFHETLLLDILREVEDLQPTKNVMNNEYRNFVHNSNKINLEFSKINYTFTPSNNNK